MPYRLFPVAGLSSRAQQAPLYRSLYAQVLFAIALGIVVGLIWPETGAAMRPLGDGFIKLVRMLIGADHLHDGRRRHRADGRDARGRPHRAAGVRLLRGRLDARADHRPGGGERPPARRRPERHAERRRHRGGRSPTAPRPASTRARSRSSSTSFRRRWSTHSRGATSCRSSSCRSWPALRCSMLGRARAAAGGGARTARPARVRDDRADHAAGADRRVRRHGVHRGPLRHRLAALARRPDGRAST